MQKKNEFTLTIILLVIGILLIILSVIFTRIPLYLSQIPLLSRFVPSFAFSGLVICFLSWRQLEHYINISRKWLYFGELYIFSWAFLISMVLVEYNWDLGNMLMQSLFFAVVISTSSFIKIRKRTLLAVFLASSVVSLVSSYVAYPFYKSGSGELFYGIRLIPKLLVSFFYVLIFETSIISLLFAYSWMSYIDSGVTEFLGKTATSTSAIKSVAIYLQIVPIVLSPLAILQTFGKTEFLEPATLILFLLCYGKFITVIMCPIIALIGKAIFSIKFLGITSLWALISLIQNLFVVFNFVAQNMDAGSYAFTLIVSSLFASALGIASSRT